MLRVGPAGLPLSCKERTIKDGVIYTKNLGLSAMEVQFSTGFIDEEEAIEIGNVAKKCDIEMHAHAPYYTTLIGNDSDVKMSFDKIINSGRLANLMGCRTLVIHPGFYGNSKEETMRIMVKKIRELRNVFKIDGIRTKIGIETMGKKELFGSLDEVIRCCQRVSDVVPVIDFAHIHARGGGGLKDKKDFDEIFNKLELLSLNRYLCHLTGVAYDEDGEIHHVPIRKGDANFDSLMDCLLERNLEVTLISESPLLEHDAMHIQILLNRAIEKRLQKSQKRK